MTRNEQDRERRQQKLADLFFEMGMDLDLIEKVSGIDKRKIILKTFIGWGVIDINVKIKFNSTIL